jgi:hypothetical protein
MTAETDSELIVTSFVPGVGVAWNFGVSGALLHANSLVDVGNGRNTIVAPVPISWRITTTEFSIRRRFRIWHRAGL